MTMGAEDVAKAIDDQSRIGYEGDLDVPEAAKLIQAYGDQRAADAEREVERLKGVDAAYESAIKLSQSINAEVSFEHAGMKYTVSPKLYADAHALRQAIAAAIEELEHDITNGAVVLNDLQQALLPAGK